MKLGRCMCCVVWLLVRQGDSQMHGQTRVDLRTQGKEADFSAFNRTRPFKTGATLPATCSVGEGFFRSDATPGQNLYLCTATDTWSQVIGSGGGGTGLEVLSNNPWTGDGRLVATDGATGRNVKQIPISYDGLNLVIPGGLSVGSGLSTGLQWTLGNPGDTGASSLVIRGGDGAANSEPGYLSVFSSHPSSPFQSFLFPCGSAGKWCASATTPGADSTDVLLSTANAETVQNKVLDNTNTFSGYTNRTAIVAPGTPAAGLGSVYIDSTSKNLAVKDDAGVVKHGVQTKAAVANSFVTAISDAGVVTVAQPASTDLSDSSALLRNTADNALGAHYYDLINIAAPASPAATTARLYFSTATGKFACKDSGGADCMPAAATGTNYPSCLKYTVAYTNAAFQAAATAVSLTLAALPARGKVTGLNVKHSTAFAGTAVTSVTVSNGNGTDHTAYSLAYDISQAVGDTVFQDTEQFRSTTMAASNIVARFTANTNFGTGAATVLTAGSVDIVACTVTLP